MRRGAEQSFPNKVVRHFSLMRQSAEAPRTRRLGFVLPLTLIAMKLPHVVAASPAAGIETVFCQRPLSKKDGAAKFPTDKDTGCPAARQDRPDFCDRRATRLLAVIAEPEARNAARADVGRFRQRNFCRTIFKERSLLRSSVLVAITLMLGTLFGSAGRFVVRTAGTQGALLTLHGLVGDRAVADGLRAKVGELRNRVLCTASVARCSPQSAVLSPRYGQHNRWITALLRGGPLPLGGCVAADFCIPRPVVLIS